MCDRFKKEGLEGFSCYNVLEMLLFFAIPRSDTNVVAHNLIDEFGSLPSVFEASYEDLLKVKGIGPNSATLLTLVPQITQRYLSEKTTEKLVFSDMEEVKKYIKTKYIGVKGEVAYLLCFDGGGRLNNCCKVSTGSVNCAVVDNRTLLEMAFRNHASNVVLVHNHPSGVAAPSKEDLSKTLELSALFRSVSINLIDHIIVANDDFFSMAMNPKFSKYLY
jgi:DNA repair protein RadC